MIKEWFKENLPLPPTSNQMIAMNICSKLMVLEPEIKRIAYERICEDPHIGKKTIAVLKKEHEEHLL